MQVVIEISNYDKEWITNGYYIPEEINIRISKAIANGTPLDNNSERAEVQAYFDGEAYGWEQGRKALIEDVKAEIAKIEIPEEVKTVDGSFAFCQALEIADIAIDRVVDKHIGKAESEGE